MSRAEQIAQDLQTLAVELRRVTRATIQDRQTVLMSIYDLQNAAMRWLAEGEH
jgi:hypothetical protein